MPIINGIDIPAGLEDSWNKIFKFADNSTQTKIIFKGEPTTRAKTRNLNIRSLFVLWESLYSGFTQERRTGWDNYWLTLPFGSHAGANGYPGSGYSAFVYVNAPLYKLGQDLLLDPPVTNLFLNGSFIGGISPWFNDGEYSWWVSDNNFLIQGKNTQSFIFQTVAGLFANETYRIKVYFKLYDNLGNLLPSANGSWRVYIIYNFGDNETRIFNDVVAQPSFSFTFVCPSSSSDPEFWFYKMTDTTSYAIISKIELSLV